MAKARGDRARFRAFYGGDATRQHHRRPRIFAARHARRARRADIARRFLLYASSEMETMMATGPFPAIKAPRGYHQQPSQELDAMRAGFLISPASSIRSSIFGISQRWLVEDADIHASPFPRSWPPAHALVPYAFSTPTYIAGRHFSDSVTPVAYFMHADTKE